jgi:hypothetical protein
MIFNAFFSILCFIKSDHRLLFIILFFIYICFGLISDFFTKKYNAKRIDYKLKIKEYRIRVVFNRILDLINENKIEEALVLYRNVRDQSSLSYLNPYICAVMLKSDNIDYNERANKALDKIKEIYNPNKVL